jgi:hypothetical protein
MVPVESSLVERLRSVDSPVDLDDWEGRDGYYVAACRVSADDVPDLIDIVRKWNDFDWPNDADLADIDQDDAELLPVTAWRTLADLKADAAVEPLVDMLRSWDGEYDDWVPEEFPHVFGKIGEAAIEPLTQLANDAREMECVRSIAARGLRCVVDYHADTRERIVSCLTEMMAAAADSDVEFNSMLLVELVELEAVEAAEAIERAFAGNLLDVGMMGDWEQVRRQLGVEGLGLTMPENPHNSINDLRRRMGIGIFSDQRIFDFGEIDADAEQAYYQRAFEAFSKSSEAQKVLDRFGDVGWFRMLLDFGVNYRGEIVDEMRPGSIREFVLDYVPRKVSTDSDAAAAIVGELAAFWEYLDRAYGLPEARPIVEWLETDGLVAHLEAELADPLNYGMAKSLFMLGKNSGYDMTSEAGIGEFMMAYNQSLQNPSLQSDKTPAPAPAPATITRGQRVGRNDPCPCGSGKKYKKCCR